DCRGGKGLVPWGVWKAREQKEVPGDVARRVSVGQQRREPRSSVAHFVNFRVAQFADQDRFSATQVLKCVQREPVRLFDSEVTPRRHYHGEPWNACCFADKVNSGPAFIILEKV